jgi:hypothetical protein
MKMCLKSVTGFCCVVMSVSVLCGCEALERKFTRTPRSKVQEEMIVSPRNYSAHPFTNDVLYRQSFVYWKSWQQELMKVLSEDSSHKKLLDCVDQSILNLEKMASYLNDEKALELKKEVSKMVEIKLEIMKTPTMSRSSLNLLKYKASRVLNIVNRGYDLTKIRAFLK